MEENEAARRIRSAGFRATPQRVALVRFLARAKRPLLVQEITRAVSHKKADQATVYRMIEAFTKTGIVREVNLHGERPRYELHDEHDHHHLVCTDCGRIEDFKDEAHERTEQRVLARSKKFAKVTGHSFDLYGLCKACAK